MPEAYIVAAVRTAGGRKGGRLAGVHPVDLAAISLDAVAERSGIDPAAIDDVIMGCVTQAGEQSLHVGRNAVLASKLPQSVPAVTIDRQCGSSQQAIQFAAQAVMSGTQDVVIAAGVESMTRAPMGLSMVADKGFTPVPGERHAKIWRALLQPVHGRRDDREEIRLRPRAGSTNMRCAATGAPRRRPRRARSTAEIVPVEVTLPDGSTETHKVDEGIRFDATLEGIGAVKLLKEDGVISAASASQICDGSSAVMVVSEAGAEGARPDPAGAHPQSHRHRRRSGDHAGGAALRHRPRACSAPA